MKRIFYILMLINFILIPNLFAQEIEIKFLSQDEVNKINNLKNFNQSQKIEKLDSIINIDKKYVFNYDNKGQFLAETHYNLDYFTSLWVESNHIEYFYNNINQLTEIKYYSYLKLEPRLQILSFITTIEYNEENNIKLIETNKILDSQNRKILYDYKEYLYKNNILTGFINNSYHPNLNKIIGVTKWENVFNDNNQLIMEGDYKWDYETNNWYLSYYFENEYNEFDSLEKTYFYQFQNNTKKYELNLTSNYIYSHNNKLIYKFNKIGSSESISSKSEYIYNEDENLTIIKNSILNKINSDFEIISIIKIKTDNNKNIVFKVEDNKQNNEFIKVEYKYINNNELIELKSSKFDFDINEWLIFERYEYLFDSNNNYVGFNKFNSYEAGIDLLTEKEFIVNDLNSKIENIIVPVVDYIDTLKTKRLSKQYYINEIKYDELQNIIDEVYYYSDFNPTSVENEVVINPNFLIFPNPTSERVSVDLGVVAVADLSIYDILGNEIMSIPNYTNKSEIDLSKLSIGTYTIQIQTETGSVSQRLLVNR